MGTSGRRRSAIVEPKRVAQSLDDAFDVEEIDLAARARPVLGGAVPVHANATPRASPLPAVKREPISNSPTSRRPCRRLCATASRRPGTSDGRSTSNLADSGFATPTISWRRRSARTAGAACASMKPKVTASGQPRRRQHPANQVVARHAGIGRRRRRRSRGGNARLELVEPVVTADLFDEIDFAQQIDAEGRRRHVPAVGGRRRIAQTERLQNPHRRRRQARPDRAGAASRSRRRCSCLSPRGCG